MKKIRVAIAGIGNCASNFIQGLEYYKKYPKCETGLKSRRIGNYDISDLEVVAAFDISKEKVGKDLSEAIWAYPNCTQKVSDVPYMNVTVQMGPVEDGWGEHFSNFFSISDVKESDVSLVLKDSKADVLVIMLPTGAVNACYKYISIALNLGISVVNGIPVLASHNDSIINLAEAHNAIIVGDDFKSQIGGTILHHNLINLLKKRGVNIDSTYQLNYAGNMDFWNLITERGEAKHQSKKRGISAGYGKKLNLDVNVSYLENQGDNKTCIVYIEGQNYSGCKVTLECKLTVVDSANASGVLCDAIRYIMIAKEKGIKGRLEAASAYFMKSPYKQIEDEEALRLLEELIAHK